MSLRRVLVTGAAGQIGSDFVTYASGRYAFRLAAHHLEKLGPAGDQEAVELELADPASCAKACRGMDTVVHLGGIANPGVDFLGGLLDSNVRGVYNILRAAKDEGCRRVIVASSVQAVKGYPLDVQSRPDDAPKPMNMYAVCKCFAEAAAHYFAHSEDLPCIVIRIGHYPNVKWTRPHARNASAYVSPRDMGQLLERCIETPGVRFEIAHGLSDNRFKIMDLTHTCRRFSYRPVDDGFRVFEVGLQYTKEWLENPSRRSSTMSATTAPAQEGTR